MRLAIFSDIHGNIHALDAVLADLDAQRPDRIYCLGDLVGYCAFPNEVVDKIRSASIPTIIGNYDDGVGFEREECGCAYKEETRSAVGPAVAGVDEGEDDDREQGVSPRACCLTFDSSRTASASSWSTAARGKLTNTCSMIDRCRVLIVWLSSSDADVIMFGHTHVPDTKTVGGVLFVNVGSVGKPKDGDPRACYALSTWHRRRRSNFRRIEYDIAAAASAIRATELPHKFARDLGTGRCASIVGSPEGPPVAFRRPSGGRHESTCHGDRLLGHCVVAVRDSPLGPGRPHPSTVHRGPGPRVDQGLRLQRRDAADQDGSRGCTRPLSSPSRSSLPTGCRPAICRRVLWVTSSRSAIKAEPV